MKATIWARGIALPAGFCYNCNAPAPITIALYSEGGIAGYGLLGAGGGGTPYEVSYCDRCAVNATKKAPDRLAPTVGLVLLVLGFGVVAFFTDGVDRLVALIVALSSVGGLLAWLRYIRRPLATGQTTRWRAFAVLNDGKDVLEGNREFARIEYSNPRILDEIRRLNPGVEVTSEDSSYLMERPHWRIQGVKDFSTFFEALPRLVPSGSLVGLAGAFTSDELIALLPEAHTQTFPDEFDDAVFLPVSDETTRALEELQARQVWPGFLLFVHVISQGRSILEWYDAPDDPIAVAISVSEQVVQEFVAATNGSYERVDQP